MLQIDDTLDQFASDPEMVAMFVSNATELVETLETDLLMIESTPASQRLDVLNRIFRAAHTIKGESGFVGLNKIGKLAHTLENALDLMREDQLQATKPVVSTLLNAVDVLQGLISHVERSEQEDLTETLNSLALLIAPVPAPIVAVPNVSEPSRVEVVAPPTVAPVVAAPALPAQAASQATTTNTPASPAGSAPQTGRVRVLVVDDEPMVCKLVSRQLQKRTSTSARQPAPKRLCE